jgi:hypothetical protein
MNISDEGRKRLLQNGFIAGLTFLDSKYGFIKELPEEEQEEIKEAISKLFSKYGLSEEIV